MAATAEDVALVADAARRLPPATSAYLETDFVLNLFETVLDYQMHTTAVVRALQFFRDHRWHDVRTLDDLDRLTATYPDDQAGNTALAMHLWGYKTWTRAHQLRELATYFRSIGVVDQTALVRWARRATFERDFKGRVKGLGVAVFHWLIMRQGVETVKPDVHVRRFAELAIGRRLADTEVVDVVVGAAKAMGMKAHELDWRIWEASRGGTLPYPDHP